MNLPIASINAGGGGNSRYDSEWRMKVRYFIGSSFRLRSHDERARAGSTRPPPFLAARGLGAVVAASLELYGDLVLRDRPGGLGGTLEPDRKTRQARDLSTVDADEM